jgi:transmembrane sensor
MDASSTYDDLPWPLIVSALQGELPAEEELQFKEWLASSAAHRETYDHIQRLYKDGLTDYPLYSRMDEDKAWTAFRQKMDQRGVISPAMGKRHIGFNRWAAAAAVIVLAFGAGWWYFAGSRSGISYQTAANEQRSVALPDGSTILLHPRTRIEVAPGYNSTGRTVLLLGGKAQFNVSHRQDHPFTVNMDGASVQDIGTSFIIEKTSDSITVMVSTGRIAFIPGKTGVRKEIAAGGAICLYTDVQHSGEIRQTAPIQAGADSLRFDNATLSQILGALEKHFGKRIRLTDPLIAQKRLTVHLDGESLEYALRVVCDSYDLEYIIKDGDYILEKKKTSKP